MKMTLTDLFPLVAKEMQWAYEKHGPYHNAHEQYAVMREEVDEWWDAVKGNTADCELYELVQVAAVALRYVLERSGARLDSADLDLAGIQARRHTDFK